MWKFRHRIRDAIVGIEELDKRHLAGRETLIASKVRRGPPRADKIFQKRTASSFHFSYFRLHKRIF